MVTFPDLPAGRPIPDTDDLRLLAELINNVSIPLANAAWNARMSQAEAAARLVSMAERGLPLRLVADGDRQALWHIAQAGPATSGVPASAPLPVPSQPAGIPAPAAVPGPGSPAVPGPGSPAGAPVVLPPTPPVPPHEQAIAGAVPLGQPPFGPSEPTPQVPEQAPAAAEPAPPPAAEQASPAAQQAPPDAEQAPPAAQQAPPDAEQAPPAAQHAPSDAQPGSTVLLDSGRHAAAAAVVPDESYLPGEPAGALWGPPGTSWARTDDTGQPATGRPAAPDGAAAEQVPAPVPPTPRAWAGIPVAGPAGEQLVVTILDVLDPGDRVLTDAGYRMEPGQRAVLVHSSVANTGQVPYYPVGDLYLVLETDTRVLLGRANIAVASHPSFPVGVTPGRAAEGWSVFLIPSETVLAGIKWCIRPDMPQTILSWPITP